MEKREYSGNKNQGGGSRHGQAADHGAAQRGILLTAFACPQRHRNHADDHRQRRHGDRAETRRAGFNGCIDRIPQHRQAVRR